MSDSQNDEKRGRRRLEEGIKKKQFAISITLNDFEEIEKILKEKGVPYSVPSFISMYVNTNIGNIKDAI